MTIKVCLAGATGWAGSALAKGLARAEGVQLVSAVSRSRAGQRLEALLDLPGTQCPVFATVGEALARPADVLVEYTKPGAAPGHIRTALERGLHVVVGTSGISEGQYREIDALARARERGVLACGSFSRAFGLVRRLAAMAAKEIEQWEILEFAHDDKVDSPSGTATALAHHLSQVRRPRLTVPMDQVVGPVESRGADLAGTRVHALRLPGYLLGLEVHFGLPGEKLSIHYEIGASAEIYVEGALEAVRRVPGLVGVHRGL
jgi:4-hydroxy-tetrahydrodipicolinate reductase